MISCRFSFGEAPDKGWTRVSVTHISHILDALPAHFFRNSSANSSMSIPNDSSPAIVVTVFLPCLVFIDMVIGCSAPFLLSDQCATGPT